MTFGITLFTLKKTDFNCCFPYSTTGSKKQQARRTEDKTLRLAKLSDLNDDSRDDQTAIETTQHEDTSNQPKDSGWVDNTVYESSNDTAGPEYIEINHQPQ